MSPPVVLDTDGSVGPLPQAQRVALQDWQDALRFSASMGTMRRLVRLLDAQLPTRYGTVLMGSGDFHHLSWPLIARLPGRQPLQVVVLDNHPDNMRFPFGVHCGSWVRRVALLPRVRQVHVLGICSADIGLRHSWENYLLPLRRGKLSYWSMGVDTRWARWLGLQHCFHSFQNPDELVAAFSRYWQQHGSAVYLSVDKDVFAPELAPTNWDQGRLQLQHAQAIIRALQGQQLLGSDITGEISAWHYRSWFKRRLSALDGQETVDAERLAEWQARQHALNLQLLAAIDTWPAELRAQ